MSNLQRAFLSSRMPNKRTLSNDELAQLLRAAKKDLKLQDLCDVVSIISLTGLRRCELENLLWTDVDFANSRLKVASPKSISERYIPVGVKVRQILEARRDGQSASEYVLGTYPKALHCRVRRQLRELAQQIGIGSICLNDLRHTFFSNLMSSGASVSSLMAIGGYSPCNSPILIVMSPEGYYEQVARDQARVEEQF